MQGKKARSPNFAVRLNGAEESLLRSAARDAGLGISTYLRRAGIAAARRRNRSAAVEIEGDSGSLELVPLTDLEDVR